MTTRYRHQNLEAWRQSIALAGKVYAASRRLPSRDGRQLRRDLQRAAAAVPSRIAEGATRAGAREFVEFLRAALGSIATLETRIVIAGDWGLGDAASLLTELAQVRTLVQDLLRTVQSARLAAHARACNPLAFAHCTRNNVPPIATCGTPSTNKLLPRSEPTSTGSVSSGTTR